MGRRIRCPRNSKGLWICIGPYLCELVHQHTTESDLSTFEAMTLTSSLLSTSTRAVPSLERNLKSCSC